MKVIEITPSQAATLFPFAFTQWKKRNAALPWVNCRFFINPSTSWLWAEHCTALWVYKDAYDGWGSRALSFSQELTVIPAGPTKPTPADKTKVHYDEDDNLQVPFEREYEALDACIINFERYLKEMPSGTDSLNLARMAAALTALHQAKSVVMKALSQCPTNEGPGFTSP